MELGLAPIVLYTDQSDHLCHFLAQLLDMEISPCDDGIVLSHELLNFKIQERDKEAVGAQQTCIEFKVKDKEQLNQIVQKVEFLNYRNQANYLPDQSQETSIKVHDPDGRCWLFSL